MLPAILNFIVSPTTIQYAIRGLAVSKKLVLPFTLTSIKKRKFDSEENPTQIALETTENYDLSQNQDQCSDLNTEKLNETFKQQISDVLEKSFIVEESYKKQQNYGPDKVDTEELNTKIENTNNFEDIIAVNSLNFDQAKTEEESADHQENTNNLEELISVNSIDFKQDESKDETADPEETDKNVKEIIAAKSFDFEQEETQNKNANHQEESFSLLKNLKNEQNCEENPLIQHKQDSSTENLENVAVKNAVKINLHQERSDNHPQTNDITKCSKVKLQQSGPKLTPIQSYTKNGTTFYVYGNSGSDFNSRISPQSTRKLASTSLQKSVPKFLEEPKPRGLFRRIPSYDYEFFLKVSENDIKEILVTTKIDRKHSNLNNWIKN